MRDRQDLAMRNQGSFSVEFKRQVIESGGGGLANRFGVFPFLTQWGKQARQETTARELSLVKSCGMVWMLSSLS